MQVQSAGIERFWGQNLPGIFQALEEGQGGWSGQGGEYDKRAGRACKVLLVL